MTTQITIVSPNDTDKAVGVTVQQYQPISEALGTIGWVDVKPTVVLQPGASMSEYIHRTQRGVIGELELVVPVEAPALDAVAEGAEPNPVEESKVQTADSSASESNGVGDTEGVR